MPGGGLFLQEIKSMVVTSRVGWGFSIAVRQKRSGSFFPDGGPDRPRPVGNWVRWGHSRPAAFVIPIQDVVP